MASRKDDNIFHRDLNFGALKSEVSFLNFKLKNFYYCCTNIEKKNVKMS